MFRGAQRALVCTARVQRQLHLARLKNLSPFLTPDVLRVLQSRMFHLDVARFSSAERSRVEETLKMLKEDLQQQEKDESFASKAMAKKSEPKPPLGTRIMNELKHYYHGCRLLVLETRISAKYLWRLANGHSLMRRERQQLVRTVSDLFRLVPFSIFVIVPFLEFTLPIFLKVFPNMLPSTFQEASKEEEKLRKRLKLKLEMAKFLQDTIGHIGLERKKSKKQPGETNKALEFAEFIKAVRTEGSYVSNEELFKYSKLFEDDLTLDNLPTSSLRALCRLLDIQPLGSPEILRFQLHLKLRELKADDKQISLEGGVDTLSVAELQQSCRARGMRSFGMSEQRLKDQLRQWLELSLNDKVPPSLLLLSRTIYLPEDMTFADRLRALLSNVSEGVAEETRQKLTELEGNKVTYKERLDLIRNIEKAIQKERKSLDEANKQRKAEEEAKKAAEELAKLAEKVSPPAAAPEVAKVEEAAPIAPAAPTPLLDVLGAQPLAAAVSAKARKKEEEAAKVKVDEKDLQSIEDVIHGSAVSEAKHDITELKEKIIEHTEDLIEVDALKKDLLEPKGAKRLRARISHIITNMDAMVKKLEEKRRTIHETIADPAVAEAERTKRVSLMRVEDMLHSLERLRKMPDEEKSKEIEQVVRALDEDTDGIIDADIVLEAIDLLSKHKDLKISAAQIKKIVEMLRKEEEMEALEAFISGLSPYPPVLEPSSPVEPSVPADAEPAPPQVQERDPPAKAKETSSG